MADNPPTISDNVSRSIGKDAQHANILAARIVADIVKTTLGPKGMDKMLVDSTGNITITNDGVTILEEMEFDHPAAKLIVESAKTQEKEVGDGTTSVALLAGKLLERAETLLNRRIHPTVIIKGYEKAAAYAAKLMHELAIEVSDVSILHKIAMTAMTGKGAEGHRAFFADLIVKAVDMIAEKNKVEQNDIKVQKVLGGSIEESQLIRGCVVDREIAHQAMPREIKDARIALVDFPLELRSPEVETKLSLSNPEQFQQFLDAEEQALRNITDKIIASGAKVVFCQKGIDDVAQYYLAKAGIMGCRRISRSQIERLSKATGAQIISNIHELSQQSLGYAGIVKEEKYGQEVFIIVNECRQPKSLTILLRGSTTHVVDELERALSDGIGVIVAALREGKVVAGGGAIEIELARKIREFGRTVGGKEQLAVEEFAAALESIPEALAENAGLDPIEVVTELKKRHEARAPRDGLNLFNDKIEDCFTAGIVEPIKVKTQAISSSTEVATMILRIDDVLISKGSSVKQGEIVE